MRHLVLYIMIPVFAVSCKVGPRPINYGEDMCHFCWMTIVDRTHGTEVVTKKGKVYKFDSIECLLNFKRKGEVDPADIAYYLVSDLYSDGEFVEAASATFLRCEQIPSPMGGYLSAFDDRSKAEDVHREMGGSLYDWASLQEAFEGYLEFSGKQNADSVHGPVLQ